MSGDYCISEDEYTEEYSLGGIEEPKTIKAISKTDRGGMKFRK